MAIDHSACDHPRTPAGRRACRAGRTPSERVGDALTLTRAERRAAGMDTPKPRVLKLPQPVPGTDPRTTVRDRVEGNGPGAVPGCRCGRHGSAAECVRAAYGPPAGAPTGRPDVDDSYEARLARAMRENIGCGRCGYEITPDATCACDGGPDVSMIPAPRRFDPDSIELPGDRKSDKQRRAELPFADRCGHVHCPHPKADHVAGVSCLNMGGGTWKSNVKKDAAAFARMYPNR